MDTDINEPQESMEMPHQQLLSERAWQHGGQQAARKTRKEKHMVGFGDLTDQIKVAAAC